MIKCFISLFAFLIITWECMAQGCSDAGFCSLNYHNTETKNEASETKNSLTIGNVFGIGDGNTFVNVSWITYNRQVSRKVYWDTKITSNYASGVLANNFNIGDVFSNISYTFLNTEVKKESLKFLAGIKIPLTSGNDKAGDNPLPMAFQSSLGTFDALFGILYGIKNWEFTNAYQIPITRQNKNTFLKEYSESSDFPSTNKFQRKTDILLRAAYNFKKITTHLTLKPNLLAIYHIGEDSYEDIFAKRQTLTGSKGLTINANIIANYSFNNRGNIDISLATPLVVREIRPDGLTRKFTIGIAYMFSF